jgi:anti-anti-sigma factor
MIPDGPRLTSSIGDDGALILAGEIDSYTAPELSELLAGASASIGVIDLRDVTFMDSSGLRVLVEANRLCSAAGQPLVVRAPSEAVHRVLEISGIVETLTVQG